MTKTKIAAKELEKLKKEDYVHDLRILGISAYVTKHSGWGSWTVYVITFKSFQDVNYYKLVGQYKENAFLRFNWSKI